jgi:chorismate synthase
VNSFGRCFRITTFGESHGAAIGVVVDGCPAGLELTEADIQRELDLRRPGQGELTSPRREPDRVEILSGVFEGFTLGSPIALVLFNRDMRPGDYSQLREVYRPGHADHTWQAKFGRRDYRGGGRSSGRETAARVAAGALARKLLASRGVHVLAFARMIGGVWLDPEEADSLFDFEAKPVAGEPGGARPGASPGEQATAPLAALRERVYASPVRCPHERIGAAMEQAIRAAADEQDSVGGVAELRVFGLPAGLGEPVFDKLQARLGAAVLSVGAVKGVEFGLGFHFAEMRGSRANDPFAAAPGGGAVPASNRAGGIAGGISTGLPVIFRAAVKPTASIGALQHTVDARGRPIELAIGGRHDPCIVPRIVPVLEHMTNLVLADLMMTRQAAAALDPGGGGGAQRATRRG